MAHILIIGDDLPIAESLKWLLEEEGHKITLSEDGSIIKTNFEKNLPDLILMDYWLPREHGGKLTQYLKHKTTTKEIPVVIISASYNIADLVKDAGADDFVAKPYTIKQILDIVEMYTNQELIS